MTPTEQEQFATIFDEREMKVLEEAMAKKEMSARAVVRHFFRMGQMTDLMQDKGYRVLYTKDDEVFDPLEPAGPKMAPMPFNESNSCNRHADCARSTEMYKLVNNRDPGANFHCHDDECEDCFGS